jgi:hypothetical protein
MTDNKINMMIKQNDSIYSSLVARSIKFERTDVSTIEDQEIKLQMLMDENTKLKEVVKNNKPPPMPKQPKQPKQESQPKKETSSKNENDGDANDSDETYEDKKVSYSTITNMEDIKRAFCNGNYDEFEKLLKDHPFKYFKGYYKYSSDKDGCQEYIARNLVKGFVRNFDDLRKYLFVCFRCYQTDEMKKLYSYPSLWIVNTTDDLKTVFGDLYEDFDFIEMSNDSEFVALFRKTPDILIEQLPHVGILKSKSDILIEQQKSLIDEQYLH